MNAVEEAGHAAIAAAVDRCARPVIFIEMTRQFGDVLHSTLVVRHLRSTRPDVDVLWGIGNRYADDFSSFTPEHLGPHQIIALPELPEFPNDGPYRVAWVQEAAKLDGVERAFGCGVHPWGWKCGSIVTAVLDNAGIGELAVPRRPWMPIPAEDHEWGRRFVLDHDIAQRFIAFEYVSYSLGVSKEAWFAELARLLPIRCVSLAGAKDPLVPGTIDGRGTTYRQAKELIRRSSCFVGSGSGLSVLASSNGCDAPMIELIDPPLSAVGCGYRPASPKNLCLPTSSPASCAKTIMDLISSTSPASPPIKRPTMRELALKRLRRKS